MANSAIRPLCRRRSDLPVCQAGDCSSALSSAAALFGLTMSWIETKVQNLGSGLPSSSLAVDSEIVEGVEELCLSWQ